MAKRFTKAERRELRALAGLAHERELSQELSALLERFEEWQAGGLDPFELNDHIHAFHDGTSRDLYKFYTMLAPQHAVAYGLVEGLLSRSEVSEEILGKLEPAISFYENERDVRDDGGAADSQED